MSTLVIVLIVLAAWLVGSIGLGLLVGKFIRRGRQ